MNKTIINKNVSDSISDQDLAQYFTNAIHRKIIDFGELKNYNSIDQLMPKRKDFLIILIETSNDRGHWVLLTKNNNTITFFDSYGMKPGAQLQFVPAHKRIELDEDHNYLLDLLNKSNYKIEHNSIQFQADGNQIKCCGRYVILYIILFNEKNYTLKQFQKFMISKSKELKLSYDQLVSYLIK
jgi:predicted class III extradiol MEMO1 family dioxygenase